MLPAHLEYGRAPVDAGDVQWHGLDVATHQTAPERDRGLREPERAVDVNAAIANERIAAACVVADNEIVKRQLQRASARVRAAARFENFRVAIDVHGAGFHVALKTRGVPAAFFVDATSRSSHETDAITLFLLACFFDF